ncbi:enoyl-CoA hydratase [Thalassospiraceae bacterium LMO-JJ14]|nr:enoyl-CoA hydratase [Thalassospiraceae bacterium LMO-JJ14]
MIASPNDTVRLDISGGIATITINRPDSLNAINDDVVTALIDITGALRKAKDVRCVVLTGAGDHFMAGGDVKRFKSKFEEFTDNDDEARAWFTSILSRIHIIVDNMYNLPMPVICAVKGAVAGAGFSLMLGCDLVIAQEGGVFTLAYCHLGTSPDGGSTWHLPRTLGMKRAMEIALLGDRFGPEKALEWGLINRVVAEADFEAEVGKLAGRLAAGPTYAYAKTKRLLLESSDNDMDTQLGFETESFVSCAMSQDFRKGVTAFVDKQKPDFTGE